jgi:aryl-alcohol dehydrogenase-like predicted oxidoreductase
LKFSNKSKLALGTAQLNTSYDITNSTYKNTDQVYKFLDHAYKKKIRIFDTATSYNNHKLLGNFIKNLNFFINLTTKFPIKRLGFSVYNKKDIKKIIELKFDKNYFAYQLPANFFNREFENFNFNSKWT